MRKLVPAKENSENFGLLKSAEKSGEKQKSESWFQQSEKSEKVTKVTK